MFFVAKSMNPPRTPFADEKWDNNHNGPRSSICFLVSVPLLVLLLSALLSTPKGGRKERNLSPSSGFFIANCPVSVHRLCANVIGDQQNSSSLLMVSFYSLPLLPSRLYGDNTAWTRLLVRSTPRPALKQQLEICLPLFVGPELCAAHGQLNVPCAVHLMEIYWTREWDAGCLGTKE